MFETVERMVYNGYTINVAQDPDPMDPRKEFDNLGTMVCFHRRYNLGDEHDLRAEDFTGWEDMKQHLRKSLGAVIILPLYLYDHGGLRMKVGSFQGMLPQGHAEFDSGPVGFIYITEEKIKEEGLDDRTPDKIEDLLRSEVNVYDDYLSGAVYGYQVIDADGEEIHSCWGFYGYDHNKSGLVEAAQHEVEAEIYHRLKTEGIQQELELG